MQTLLKVQDLVVTFPISGGELRAVDGVSFELNQGETLAVVGESGCGKTTLAKAIMGLLKPSDGEVIFQGNKVTGNLRRLAEKIGIVWQDPYASLDPRWKIGRSILEPMNLHNKKNGNSLRKVMNEVGLDEEFKERFPHELSGGQRQRVAIARALILNPPLVICDEPTAALDLSIRAQILNLLRDLQSLHNCAYLYISHDLTTVRYIADKIAVMYLGRIVEMGDIEEVFATPSHPYTKALLDSAPTLEQTGKLPKILPGEIPDQKQKIIGCRFHTRCPYKQQICEAQDPPSTIYKSKVFCCHFPLTNHTSQETHSHV